LIVDFCVSAEHGRAMIVYPSLNPTGRKDGPRFLDGTKECVCVLAKAAHKGRLLRAMIIL